MNRAGGYYTGALTVGTTGVTGLFGKAAYDQAASGNINEAVITGLMGAAFAIATVYGAIHTKDMFSKASELDGRAAGKSNGKTGSAIARSLLPLVRERLQI